MNFFAMPESMAVGWVDFLSRAHTCPVRPAVDIIGVNRDVDPCTLQCALLLSPACPLVIPDDYSSTYGMDDTEASLQARKIALSTTTTVR